MFRFYKTILNLKTRLQEQNLSEIFLPELNFVKGDTNIYFEYITLFEKKKKDFY